VSGFQKFIKISSNKTRANQQSLLKFFLSLSLFSLLLSFFSFSVLFYKKEREREKRK